MKIWCFNVNILTAYKVEVAILNKHRDKKSLKNLFATGFLSTSIRFAISFLAVCKNIYKIEVVVFPCLQTWEKCNWPWPWYPVPHLRQSNANPFYFQKWHLFMILQLGLGLKVSLQKLCLLIVTCCDIKDTIKCQNLKILDIFLRQFLFIIKEYQPLRPQ